MRNRRLGGVATTNLAFLRERVERQRSVIVPSRAKTGSLEDLNCDLRNDVENTRNSSVERLDTQLSTLHQDVATLSMEVCSVLLHCCNKRLIINLHTGSTCDTSTARNDITFIGTWFRAVFRPFQPQHRTNSMYERFQCGFGEEHFTSTRDILLGRTTTFTCWSLQVFDIAGRSRNTNRNSSTTHKSFYQLSPVTVRVVCNCRIYLYSS